MNDRALLLIYHLGRDLETAVSLLESAIRLGEERLASDDAPTDARELRDLQEAVGDAYGNLGTYHLRYTEDLAAARRNFEKSLEFYPYAQRAGTRDLQRIERLERERETEENDGDDR
jgi:hypothetical protein